MNQIVMSKARRAVLLSAAILLVAFHLGLIFSGLVPNLVARPLHVALILPWIFIFSDVRQARLETIFGVVLAVLAMAAAVWVAWNADGLADQYGFVESGFHHFLVGG